MQNPSSLGMVFIASALIFLIVSFRDYLRTEGKMTLARKVWLRIAFIFACVGIGLFLLQTFVR
jgi:hypothetical protein